MQKIKDNLGLIIVSSATVIYLFLLFYIFFDLAEFSSLKLNEKGDVLAGVFAPLAFLWLVYGYYQQGQELKQNTDALRLQAEELANSVEQQQVLANATAKQLELLQYDVNLKKSKALPIFNLADDGFNTFRIRNHGGDAKEVHLILETGNFEIDIDKKYFSMIKADQDKLSIQYKFSFSNIPNIERNSEISIGLNIVCKCEFNENHTSMHYFRIYKDHLHGPYIELEE